MPATFETVIWKGDSVALIDQRILPLREEYLELRTPEAVADAITTMVVRGAPAIGVTAAMGLALGAKQAAHFSAAEFCTRFDALCRIFAARRSTRMTLSL